MTKPQVILGPDGKPAFAVIPWADYLHRAPLDAEAQLSDEDLYDRAKAAKEESFPAAVVDRLLAGKNPLQVYRKHRGMTQRDLAKAAGLNTVYLSQIETGKRTGSTRTLAAIARALSVDIDDLI